MRLDAAPTWLNVEQVLAWLGFEDTAAGRKSFDEFVIEVDLKDFSSKYTRGHQSEGLQQTKTHQIVDDERWRWLIAEVACANNLTQIDFFRSKYPHAVSARRMVCWFARKRWCVTYHAIGEKLSITTARVCQLLTAGLSSEERHKVDAVARTFNDFTS